jgi:hypothetical protein
MSMCIVSELNSRHPSLCCHNRWRGVVDILRVKSRLQHQRSTDSLQYDSDNDDNELASSSHSTSSSSRVVESAAAAAMRACALYVVSGGATASPGALHEALRARTERASLRAFGLNALAALVQQLSQPAAASAPAVVTDDGDFEQQQQLQQQKQKLQYAGHSAVAEALVFLRPALQCTRATTSSSSSAATTVAAASTSLLPAAATAAQHRRHHCLTGLEGCRAAAAHSTHCAFTALYALLGALLTDALVTRRPQTRLAHLLMTAWAIDLEPRDAAAVATAGVLPALQRLASLTAAADIAASRQRALLQCSDATATNGSSSTSSSAVVQWQPWSQQGVREGVLKGVLLGRDLARHISALPGGAVPHQLLIKLNLQRDTTDATTAADVADAADSADSEQKLELDTAGVATAAQLMARHSVQSLAAAYGELVEVYIGQVSDNDSLSLHSISLPTKNTAMTSSCVSCVVYTAQSLQYKRIWLQVTSLLFLLLLATQCVSCLLTLTLGARCFTRRLKHDSKQKHRQRRSVTLWQSKQYKNR